MIRKVLGTAGVGLVSLALVACGGGDGTVSVPSYQDVVACLRSAGADAETLDLEPGHEMVGAQAADGDVIFVVNATATETAEVRRGLRKGANKAGRGGHLTLRTANEGATVVGVLGVIGRRAGIASPSSQNLARRCASDPRGAQAPPA